MRPGSFIVIASRATALLLFALTLDGALAQTIGPMRSVVSISGQVVMEDGTPPPRQAAIERTCGGTTRPETYTDAKGRFSFQLGGNQPLTTSASVGSEQPGSVFDRGSKVSNEPLQVTERDIMGCSIQASLTGYVSDVIPLAGRKLTDKPNIGTIVLHPPGKAEGSTISVTSANAPQDAKRAYASAQVELKDKKFADARKALERAVQIYPQYAAAWNDLGSICLQLEDQNRAREAYAKAVEADPKFVLPLVQLVEIAARQRQYQEVVSLAERASRLDAVNFPSIYYLSAVASYSLQNYDAAEKSAREAIKIDAQHRYSKAHHLLGALLALKGSYSEAAGQLKMYLELVPGAPDAEAVKRQLAEVEKTAAAGQAVRQ
jgi:tetratricopeptide (TPR) repeat protein